MFPMTILGLFLILGFYRGEIAVIYGPDPMLIDEIACNEEADIEFVVDVDSDMYGRPLP